MEIVLIIIIGILGLIIFLQHYKKIQVDEEIKYITQKLEEIIGTDSTERVKLFTTSNKVKGLISVINEILDYSHRNKIKYNKTSQSMKRMLSNISHDLKTPLTVILGYTEMLQATGKEKNKVEKIYLKATELLDLINKFFDLAKLESGDKHYPISKVNIGELCKITLLDFYDSLCNDGIELAIDIPGKNVYALGNEEAISRILNNLISNASKYGKDGKFLGLTLREEEEFIRIDVIDKGKGIEGKYKEDVFERIFTLEDSRSKSYQGSGLGLTITKHLVEALGGDIYLKSIPNESTIFSFRLNKANY